MKRLLSLFCILCAGVALQAQMTGPQRAVWAGSITAGGSDCSVATRCVSMNLPPGTSGATVQLGGTFSATNQFEASPDLGSSWVNVPGNPMPSGSAASSATGTGTWQFGLSGFTDLRVRASAYTSGTVSVHLTASTGSARNSGAGSGASTFDALGSGTNTVAAMVVGAGASLGFTGGGTIDASSYKGQAGPTATQFSYLDPTSSIQTQINGKVGTATTVNGHALSSNVTVSASDVGLGSVTNDAQAKASIVPNTVPSAAQILVGNAGGTAYAPVSVSGDVTLSSAGAVAVTKINGTLLSGLATGVLVNTTGTGVPVIGNRNSIDGATGCTPAGASSTDYACNLSPAIGAYNTNVQYRFKADVANTASAGKPTIAFNGQAAKQIVKVQGGITTALAANDIRAGQEVDTVYDGTNMQMVSQLGNAASGTGTVTSSGSPGAGNIAAFTSATDVAPAKADQISGPLYCAPASASATAYTCTHTPALTAYVTGTIYLVKFDLTNGASPAINFDSLGAKNLVKVNGGITTALGASDVLANQTVAMMYDGTSMEVWGTVQKSDLASLPLSIANGGTGTASTLTGLVRGSGSAMTAAELSGDASTSGSNAVTVAKINGASFPTSALAVGSNSSAQPVASLVFTTGTSRTMSANSEIFVCTSTCTFTPPATGSTVAGMQFCVQNDDNVSTVITLAAVTSIQYEATARTSYGTAAHTMTSAVAVASQICMVAVSATKWNVFSNVGTWTNN